MPLLDKLPRSGSASRARAASGRGKGPHCRHVRGVLGGLARALRRRGWGWLVRAECEDRATLLREREREVPTYVCTARWQFTSVSTPVIASYQLQTNERTVISANDYDGAFSGRVDLAGREG